MGRGGDETAIDLGDITRAGFSGSAADLELADAARKLREVEAALAASEASNEALRKVAASAVTTCRGWIENERCTEPAEFLLWGKLFPPDALGPQCYSCAIRAGATDSILRDPNAAILNLKRFRDALGD